MANRRSGQPVTGVGRNALQVDQISRRISRSGRSNELSQTPKIIAHRGWSALAPENTLAAFRAAIEVGADGIELDVQLSKDGHVVVIHDEKLDRTTNGSGPVADHTLAELSELDAGGWFAPKYAGEPLPTLAAVFDLVRDTAWNGIINVELKTSGVPYPGIEKAVVDLIRSYGLSEQVLISSFNHYSLAETTRIAPEIKTAILYTTQLYKPWEYAKGFGCAALHPRRQPGMERLVAGAKEAGLAVNVWTINSTQHADELAEAGVTGLITDVPDELLRHFGRG